MFKHLAPAVLAAILLAGCAPSLGPGEPSTTPTTVAPHRLGNPHRVDGAT